MWSCRWEIEAQARVEVVEVAESGWILEKVKPAVFPDGLNMEREKGNRQDEF